MSDIIVIWKSKRERERERREYLERQHAWVAKKDMQFYFIQNLWLCGKQFLNVNINFYFILFTQNFQVEHTINWPKGNLRKEQRSFQFGWWRLGVKGRYRGCEAITWRQDSHQGALGKSPYCESLWKICRLSLHSSQAPIHLETSGKIRLHQSW